MAEHCGIPKSLLDRWHFEDSQLLDAIRAGALGDLTVSSLLKSHLRAFIDRQNAEESRGRPLPSLKSMALAAILQILDTADDLNDTAQYIVSNLNDVAIRDLLTDARMRYPILRACLAAANNRMEAGRDFIDIDEAVYANARYIFSRGIDNVDSAYVLTLEDFCKIIPIEVVNNRYGRLTRQNPPKGGFEFLDAKRKCVLDLCTSSSAFEINLQKVTGEVLQGLDWNNVLLAGDLVLHTVLQGQDIHEDDESLTVYGGHCEEHMDDVGNSSFYGRVFDHDAYAGSLKWQGIQLYLYGLSVEEANAKVEEIYTVWKHNCRLAYEPITVTKTAASITFFPSRTIRPGSIKLRLFKNATEVLLHQELDQSQIGYDGSRVIMSPSCARALETGYTTFKMHPVVGGQHGGPDARLMRFLDHADIGFGFRIMPFSAVALRKPVHGQSHPPVSRKRYDIMAGFKALRDLARRTALLVKDKLCLTSPTFPHSYVRFCHYERGLPDDVALLGDIRGLLEFSEAWRQTYLEQQHLVPEDARTDSSLLEDELYLLHPPMDSDSLTFDIDEANESLFEALRKAICERLQIPTQTTGYNNYLTRRIRRQLHGPTLDAVQEKQITIPIMIPLELDSYICDTVESITANQRPLIQVHDPSKHDPQTARLPSLQDVSGPTGNIRYWLITNNTMWAGQDPVLDEISQVLWSLFGWFKFVQNWDELHYRPRLPYDTATPECLFWVVQGLRRRLGPHPVVCNSDDDLRRRQGLLPLREALMFGSFVHQDPPFRGGIEAFAPEDAAALEDLPVIPEDEDGWEDGDEGDWGGDGVPAWIDVANVNHSTSSLNNSSV